MSNSKPIDINILKLGSSDTQEALGAVNKLKESNVNAIPALIQALDNENSSINTMAIIVLGELQEKAKEAVPRISQMIFQDDEQTRMAAALALLRIGKTSIPYLKKIVNSDDFKASFWAVWSLALLDPNHVEEKGLKLLKRVYDDPESPVEKLAAEEAMGIIISKRID
ncbi:HEAT repeat domain-containing protein [Peribacillus castrilensis]|uniref:Sporulation killing factor biosynthesis and export n=1 Tax=Peribacillus simplex TaxID=1478 RepID=A0AAN2PL09_9BACI|nr:MULTISPECIES: HEAT repeat domain-containing protein [Bacillaceae]MCP1093161.1 HEAT repeat domain-containing protein [Bacillaceae bacterium OS4b]MBD8591664.1 HEAT repeat domain-containing protein [Peribacillus simplex]MCF7623773.1 HEAT repeat domain-containing protein [Peribacillus frigoritolerans]MCP1154319.1 HEAT repeat domain-containing protein [Peribacillus frigoritolerans]MCT1390860.1 HEAT repeat domain-containing protein [Peribacillus frigoritolerans]